MASPPDPPLVAHLAAAWPHEKWRDLHVLAAVSGGADSIALLRALLVVKERAGGRGRLYVGHVDHGLRSEAAQADAQWLARQCQRLNVPLHIEHADVHALAAAQGDGVESAARTVRYQLLTSLAERLGARFVAIAHTADDQVETVLFRFLRGSGLRGLAGIPRSRPLSPSVTLVRPLLDATRQDVQEYLAAIDQPYRQDLTNDNLDFARNRLRHELLPQLRTINQEVDAAIGRIADHAAEAQVVVDQVAADLLAECRRAAPLHEHESPSASITLSVAPLVGKSEFLVAEVLRQAWRAAALPEQSMTHHWWRQLARFAQAPEPQPALNLPANLRATRPAPQLVAIMQPPSPESDRG